MMRSRTTLMPAMLALIESSRIACSAMPKRELRR
jgi:hypothetical protein